MLWRTARISGSMLQLLHIARHKLASNCFSWDVFATYNAWTCTLQDRSQNEKFCYGYSLAPGLQIEDVFKGACWKAGFVTPRFRINSLHVALIIFLSFMDFRLCDLFILQPVTFCNQLWIFLALNKCGSHTTWLKINWDKSPKSLLPHVNSLN